MGGCFRIASRLFLFLAGSDPLSYRRDCLIADPPELLPGRSDRNGFEGKTDKFSGLFTRLRRVYQPDSVSSTERIEIAIPDGEFVSMFRATAGLPR